MELDLRYADLHACVSCIGFTENDVYKKNVDATESIKDILRYIRRENSSLDIRRELGKLKIVSSDLIPLLRTFPHDEALFDLVMRLLMNLTQPAFICFKQEIPKDREMRGFYIQVDSLLKEYKRSFADEALMRVLSSKVGEIFDKPWEERSEEERLLIERILILIRNILHVSPDPTEEQRTDEDVSVHDEVLWAMHMGGWDDLLFYLANSHDEQSFAFHTLEIISLMFREQTPEILANAGRQDSIKDDPGFKLMERIKYQEEALKKREIAQMNVRHNRFGGTFEIRNMKSIGDRCLVYHHDVTKSDVTLDRDKPGRRKPKNTRPITDKEVIRRSTLTIRLHLRDFCWRFLQFGYNLVMRSAHSSLERQSNQADDETYYLWSIRFFSAFCRLHDFKIEYICETMQMDIIHWVYSQAMTYFENVRMEKSKSVQWSRRLQLAMAAYRELLNCLQTMERSADTAVKHSATTIKAKLLYQVEYREIYPLLIKSFDQTKQSRSYLQDLVEGAHVLIRMLQQQSSSGLLIVQKKSTRKSHNSKKGGKPKPTVSDPPYAATVEQLETRWDAMSDVLSAGIHGDIELPPAESLPLLFDPTLENVSMEDQQKFARRLIKMSLVENEPLKAIALLKTARELWPEGEELQLDDDFLALRNIFLSDLEASPQETNPSDPPEDPDEEEAAQVSQMHQEEKRSQEVPLDMKEFVLHFAHPDIIQAYSHLFADYATNPHSANRCVLRLLYRLAVECNVPALLYQLRFFRIVDKFMKDPLSSTKEFKELKKFCIFVLRKFFEHAQSNDKLIAEILFHKNRKECVEATQGYGTYEDKSKKDAWSPELDDELKRLYEEFRQEELTPGRDLADMIHIRLSDVNKTRRQVVIRMCYFGFINSAKDLKKRGTASFCGPPWTDEEVALLGRLVTENLEARDPLGNIRANLQVKRTKASIVQKAIEAGFVDSPSALKYFRGEKKRRRTLEEGHQRGPNFKRAKTAEEVEKQFLSEEFIHSSDESSSDNDDNDVTRPTVDRNSAARPSSSKSLPKKTERVERSDVEVAFSATKVKEILPQVPSELTSWLVEQLESAQEDRAAGVLEPIPLVAFLTEDAERLVLPSSQTLLRAAGLKEPQPAEGERYWRIPGSMSATLVGTFIDVLRGGDVIEPELIESEATFNTSGVSLSSLSSLNTTMNGTLISKDGEEDLPSQKTKKSKKDSNTKRSVKKKAVKEREQHDSSSSDSEEEAKKPARRRLTRVSSSSSDDGDSHPGPEDHIADVDNDGDLTVDTSSSTKKKSRDTVPSDDSDSSDLSDPDPNYVALPDEEEDKDAPVAGEEKLAELDKSSDDEGSIAKPRSQQTLRRLQIDSDSDSD